MANLRQILFVFGAWPHEGFMNLFLERRYHRDRGESEHSKNSISASPVQTSCHLWEPSISSSHRAQILHASAVNVECVCGVYVHERREEKENGINKYDNKQRKQRKEEEDEEEKAQLTCFIFF